MTARHSAAVARYAREIAAAAGLSEEEQELAHTAGLLHDIGKFILPDRILKGDVELTEADWVEIRKHPYEGARIVSQIDGYQPVGDVILAHHERPDGKGYPLGLHGEEIPMLSKVIAVADTYDVLTARDSYRRPVSTYEAIAELRRSAGTQLEPSTSRSSPSCSSTRIFPTATARTRTSKPSWPSTGESTNTRRLARRQRGRGSRYEPRPRRLDAKQKPAPADEVPAPADEVFVEPATLDTKNCSTY